MADDSQNLEKQQSLASVEATIESNVQGGTESSCNNGETSVVTSDADREKSLEFSDELMEKGSMAEKENDYAEATECYSRALEIRVSHYGELSPLCVNAYYKYGRALLYKAQDEADPLGAVPKKDVKSGEVADNNGSVNSAKTSAVSESSNVCVGGSSNSKAADDENVGKDMEEDDDDDESDAEDLAEGDEDDSDLDLAWKMLDVARFIVEKNSDDTLEKVDVLSALAEVALEREDVETSLSDYLKALSILERVVEPDSRLLAELNFRICLCLEIGSKAQEAIPYCEKAISVCKSRVQRLTDEVKASSGTKSAPAESDQSIQHSSNATLPVDSVADKEAEIENLTGLSGELEKKLEDLQQLVSNPNSILSDILGLVSAKAKAKANETSGSSVSMGSSRIGTANSSEHFESPTLATSQTNGSTEVKHLGVVGRGVKRLQNPTEIEPTIAKKPALGPSEDQGAGNAP